VLHVSNMKKVFLSLIITLLIFPFFVFADKENDDLYERYIELGAISDPILIDWIYGLDDEDAGSLLELSKTIPADEFLKNTYDVVYGEDIAKEITDGKPDDSSGPKLSDVEVHQITQNARGGYVRNLPQLIQKIADLVSLTIPVIIGMGLLVFLWGVMQYAIAKGVKEKENAVGLITYGIIALFVMISVWGLVNLISDTVGTNVPQGGTIETKTIPVNRLIK